MTSLKNKKLIVHVGYSKCGSTTIQDTLDANRQLLIDKHVLFPKVLAENPSWLRFFWEKQLPATYQQNIVDDKFESFSAELRSELKQTSADTVILSDEGLISLSEGSVQKFKEFLECEFSGFEINIVIIAREPVSFFTSRCQQFISNRYFDMDAVKDFLDGRNIVNGDSRADNLAMNPTSFYSKPVGIYDKVFNNVHILQFEEAIKDQVGMTHFFLKSFGLDVECSDIRKNESRSWRAIELIAYINSKFVFSWDHEKNNLRYWNDLKDFFSISGGKYSLPKATQELIRGKTRGQAEWLQKRCGVDYTDQFTDANDEPNIWDDTFSKEIVSFYPKQSVFVKVLIASFVDEKCASVEDAVSKDSLAKLRTWIGQEDPYSALLSKLNFSLVVKLILFKRWSVSKMNVARQCLARSKRSINIA